MRISFILILALVSGCSLLKKSQSESPFIQQPQTPEEAKAALKKTGQDLLYGQGLGEGAVTAGSVIVFPPYGAYVLGNAILTLSGYEKIEISNALPEGEKHSWDKFYNKVTEGPGRFAAAIAGEEFRSEIESKTPFEEYQNAE